MTKPRPEANRDTPAVCPECDGTGWRPINDDPGAAVRRCACHATRDLERRVAAALIPLRYRGVELANFSLYRSIDGSLEEARLIAEKFVAAFPAVEAGLLFAGPAGIGKTHLAVAVLRELVVGHGVVGRFVDYRDLLGAIQDSYNPVSETSELQIVRPVLDAEILVIDDLGRRRPTVWVQDTVTQILNDRYKNQRVTLITTNFGDDDSDPSVATLAEQIGPYARSRLHEMCRTVPMRGEDFRRITGSGTVAGLGEAPAAQDPANRARAS